jgi:hypothetical protein
MEFSFFEKIILWRKQDMRCHAGLLSFSIGYRMEMFACTSHPFFKGGGEGEGGDMVRSFLE